MREVAVKHMFNTLTNTSPMPREEKKNQIASIGLLAFQMSSSISKTLSERLGQEATVMAKKALKKLSDKSSGSSESVITKGRKRKHIDASSETSQKTNEQNKRMKEEDTESDVSLNGISDKSVSSVHTSDLSSFDDEIVVSSEDEKGEKKEKRISFKTANKAYFDDGFSNIRNVIVSQKKNTDEASKESKTKKNSSLNTSSSSAESKSISPRPKRERKPNSKYSAEDMYF
ncbi:unnamed protein product [Larinioides sclopetarius]|uniref:Uncharacterized protein n=1 Tax=Larinioides sclopetarius TaxID=280406 RepID=A0AAV1ZU06_9ARAC